MLSTILAIVFSGSEVTGNWARERKRPFRSTIATVASFGRISATSITRSSLSPTMVGRRPRGSRAVAPSRTQRSSINWFTISEIVLGCKPESRESSAREIGWLARITSSTTSRLMSLAISLEARRTYARSTLCIPRIMFYPNPAYCRLRRCGQHKLFSSLPSLYRAGKCRKT